MPRLSVLLPAKDAARTIGPAVRSTLRAMPRDAELLVMDDGSTDGTGSVLDAISDPRLRVLRHGTPHGVAGSLNAALAATDSDLVARMDADDVTLPGRFRLQLPALRTADLVFGSMLLIDARSRPVGLSSPAPVHPLGSRLHLLLENPFAHPTLLGTREALTRAGGYRATQVEDYDLWLRAAAGGARLRKLRVPVLAYRRHAGQATQTWSRDPADAVLDQSYGALLPERFRPLTSSLRLAAVLRDRTGVPETQWAQFRTWLAGEASSLPNGIGRGLLRRLARAD